MTTAEVEDGVIRELGRKGTGGFAGEGLAFLALSTLLDQEASLPSALQVLLIF